MEQNPNQRFSKVKRDDIQNNQPQNNQPQNNQPQRNQLQNNQSRGTPHENPLLSQQHIPQYYSMQERQNDMSKIFK